MAIKTMTYSRSEDKPDTFCEYCTHTDYGDKTLISHPDSLCEGNRCQEAEDYYDNFFQFRNQLTKRKIGRKNGV